MQQVKKIRCTAEVVSNDFEVCKLQKIEELEEVNADIKHKWKNTILLYKCHF